MVLYGRVYNTGGGDGTPSNLPREFQRFGLEKLFRAGSFSDLG